VKPGIYNITDEEYFAVEAASNSGLKAVGRSPAHFKYQQENPTPPSPQMLEGLSIHCATLEPDQFTARHAIIPDNAPRKPTIAQINSKKPSEKALESMQFWEQWDLLNKSKLVVTTEDAAKYLEIGKLIRTHPELSVFFEKGKAEQAVFATDPNTGVLCKCKPDFLTEVKGYKICLELKTAPDARPVAFRRDAFKFGYFTAAAFYQDVMGWSIGRPDLYLFIVIERDPPYGIKTYEPTAESIFRGTDLYRANLDLYAYCMKTGEWPNYDVAVEPLDMPGWDRD
jgi:exodeoxyribonuclease VIII